MANEVFSQLRFIVSDRMIIFKALAHWLIGRSMDPFDFFARRGIHVDDNEKQKLHAFIICETIIKIVKDKSQNSYDGWRWSNGLDHRLESSHARSTSPPGHDYFFENRMCTFASIISKIKGKGKKNRSLFTSHRSGRNIRNFVWNIQLKDIVRKTGLVPASERHVEWPSSSDWEGCLKNIGDQFPCASYSYIRHIWR